MAGYLFDTHTLLWASMRDKRLSPQVLDLLQDPTHEWFVSIGSYWELTIKSSLNKLNLPESVGKMMIRAQDAGIQTLSIQGSYLNHLADLPFHHRDPFDRLIIATALAEDLIILSKDAEFRLYGAQLTW